MQVLHAYSVAILGFLISNLVVENVSKLIKCLKNVSFGGTKKRFTVSRTYCDDVIIHPKDMLNK